VIDCFSRRLVGWSIADHMRTELVADTLTAAAGERGSLGGAVFHSDHGAQYSSGAYANLCTRLGVTRSMGAVGSSADNALAESFNATLKRETLAGAPGWDSPAAARRAVFSWITRYNTRRRHSTCGQVSPITYETTYTPTTL
jgi:transposase InsO family protein